MFSRNIIKVEEDSNYIGKDIPVSNNSIYDKRIDTTCRYLSPTPPITELLNLDTFTDYVVIYTVNNPNNTISIKYSSKSKYNNEGCVIHRTMNKYTKSEAECIAAFYQNILSKKSKIYLSDIQANYELGRKYLLSEYNKCQ